jgi:hypothetical protein
MLDKTRFMRAFGPKGLKPVELWFLSIYLDRKGGAFLEPTKTVRLMFPDKPASYHGGAGPRFRSRLSEHINNWLEEDGLSEVRLKERLYKLLDVQSTKFQKIKGQIDKSQLPKGAVVVTTGYSLKTPEKRDGDGNIICPASYDVENIVAITVDAPELQIKILEDLVKMKGMNAPERIEIGGLDDVVAKLTEARERRRQYRDEPIEADYTERTEDVKESQDLLDFLE